MKQISVIIQLAIAAILIFSWMDHQFMIRNSETFESIIAFHKALERSIYYVRNGISRSIENGIRLTEKSPSQKIFIDKSKQVQSLCEDIYLELEICKKEFYEWETGLDSEEQQDKLPLNYSSKEVVQKTFIEKGKAKKLSELLQTTFTQLEGVIQLQDEYPRLSKQEINTYYANQNKILSSQTTLIDLVLNVEDFEKLIKNYDVIHTKSLLDAIEYDIAVIEMELVKNILRLIRKDEEPKSDYIMVMNYDKLPIVGQSFTARFRQRAYGEAKGLIMKVNGKEVRKQGGFGIFDFTPKTTKPIYFRLEIELKNPFTGKTDVFRRTIKKEVAD